MSLFEDVVFYLGRKSAVTRLREESGGSDDEAVRVGVVLSLPVAIGNLQRWVQREDQAEWFGEALANIPPANADDLDALLDCGTTQDLANDVLDLTLGEDAPRIVDRLAKRAQLADGTAARLLSIATAAQLAHIARLNAGVHSPETLRLSLAAEEIELDEAGWKPWIEETLADERELASLEEWQRERIEAGLTDLAASPNGTVDDELLDHAPRASATIGSGLVADRIGEQVDDPLAFPPPRVDTRSSSFRTDDLEHSPLQPAPRLTTASPTAGAITDHRSPVAAAAPAPPNGRPTGLWAALAGVGIAAVLALVAFVLLRDAGGPTDEVVADETATSTSALVDEAAAPNASLDDDGAPQSTTAPPAIEGQLQFDVPMIDPLGRNEGTGNAVLDFDPDTGEICYEFEVDGVASPYDAHIHVGPAGVKGGIVVNFGLLDGNTSGCLANSPAGTTAVLADLSGHYVEFHDADGLTTVRAQLAEATGAPAEVVEEVDTGGAFARIEPGRLVLTGDVPDQVTIDKYLETFSDLDPEDIEIVNEMTIAEGAPRPSGRILVEDQILFDFDSADLADPNSTVLRDLATLFVARPAWRMTVVGHTDDIGTDVYNLELSLRRATAIRDALIAAGVSADALTVEGAGSREPIAPNDSEANRSQNRRIEVEVTPG